MHEYAEPPSANVTTERDVVVIFKPTLSLCFVGVIIVIINLQKRLVSKDVEGADLGCLKMRRVDLHTDCVSVCLFAGWLGRRSKALAYILPDR